MYDHRFGSWQNPRYESYVPEVIENKDEVREELRILVKEFLKNGGVIEVHGANSSEVITRKEIKERFNVTEKQLKKWVKEMKFPAKIVLNGREKFRDEKNRVEAREKDLYYLREVETFFKNELYDRDGYERGIILFPGHSSKFER